MIRNADILAFVNPVSRSRQGTYTVKPVIVSPTVQNITRVHAKHTISSYV